MQTIQFFNSSAGSNGQKAIAPVVTQKSLTIAVGAGAVAQDLLPAITAGTVVPFGGQVVNNGCYDVKLSITYLTGADCDSCTVDTLTTQVVDVIVPKNSVFPIPDGYYQQITATTVDSAGVAVANTTEQKLALHSAFQPSCTDSVVAI